VSDVKELLRRQAAWQRTRGSLSWSEKVRMVEAIRASILQLRRTALSGNADAPTTEPRD